MSSALIIILMKEKWEENTNWEKLGELDCVLNSFLQLVVYQTDSDAGLNCIYFSEYWNTFGELDATASEEDL